MTRRTFLKTGAAVAAGPGIAFSKTSASVVKAALAIDTSQIQATVPANFTGLSYEAAQLAHPDFFSSSNKRLAAFVRTLGARGVLRIGGNTSEFTVWSPQGASAAVTGAVGPDTGRKIHRSYPITSKAIRNLAAFVEAVDWQLIYGLNLGKGTPEQAAREAKAVSDATG
ncbi:MAG: twin-arginine translocation signal domain-containing protein, partial [Bryobacteraceae bacterium]